MTSGAHDHPDYALAASVDDQFAVMRGYIAELDERVAALEQGDTITEPEPEPEPPPVSDWPIPKFTQATIDKAMTEVRTWRITVTDASGATKWVTKTGPSFEWEQGWNNTGTIGPSSAMSYLALVAFYDPAAKSTSGASVADQVATTIRTSVTGGKEPSVHGVYGWGVPTLASTIILAKHTPAVWDKLTAGDKERVDWLMRVFAVVGNYMHNDGHDDNTLDVSLSRSGGHLPNQRGYVAPMGYTHIYFGGADKVNDILNQFSWSEYLAAHTGFGWTRNRAMWTAKPQTKDMFEGRLLSYTNVGQTNKVTNAGVRRPFKFRGLAVDPVSCQRTAGPSVQYDPAALFYAEEAGYMYGLNVRNQSVAKAADCSVYGKIVGANSKYTGKLGMCYEFSAAEGRSSYHYAVAGNRPAIVHWATLTALGVLPADDPVHRQVWTANAHLYDEVGKQGWLHSDGQGRCNETRSEAEQLNWASGYVYGREIWTAMLKPATPD